MTLNRTLALGTAGAVATAIGAALAFAPAAFLAGSDIALGADPSLRSELRAPGAGLALSGLVMLAALWRAALRPTALIVAFVIYAGFPVGRLVGIAFDGMPSGGIVAALLAEIVIALWLARAFLTRPRAVVI